MDKAFAEQILELSEPYNYATLRKQWRNICAQYHPDRSAATGMDENASNDILKDVNEAFMCLKPYVEHGDVAIPSAANESYSPHTETASVDNRTNLYAYALTCMRNAKTAKDFDMAQALFDALGDYLDSRKLSWECSEESRKLRTTTNPQTGSQRKATKKKCYFNVLVEIVHAEAAISIMESKYGDIYFDDPFAQLELKSCHDAFDMLRKLYEEDSNSNDKYGEGYRARIRNQFREHTSFDKLYVLPFYHMFRATCASCSQDSDKLYSRVHGMMETVCNLYLRYVWESFDEMLDEASRQFSDLPKLVENYTDAVEDRAERVMQ